MEFIPSTSDETVSHLSDSIHEQNFTENERNAPTVTTEIEPPTPIPNESHLTKQPSRFLDENFDPFSLLDEDERETDSSAPQSIYSRQSSTANIPLHEQHTFEALLEQNKLLLQKLDSERGSRVALLRKFDKIMNKQDEQDNESLVRHQQSIEETEELERAQSDSMRAEVTVETPPPLPGDASFDAIAGEYLHWIDHYKNGFQLDADWYVPPSEDEFDVNDLLSELSLEPVQDDYYFSEMERKQQERHEWLTLKQIYRVLRGSIKVQDEYMQGGRSRATNRTHLPEKQHQEPPTTEQLQITLQYTMMNLLSPPRELQWVLKTTRLSRIASLYARIEFHSSNPCYDSLVRGLVILRTKWKLAAPTLVTMLRNLFEFASVNKQFMSMIEQGSLSKLVRATLDAIKTFRKDQKVLEEYVEQVSDAVEHLQTSVEHALERINSRQERTSQKYDSLLAKADAPSRDKLEQVGFEAYKDKYDSLINKRIVEYNRFELEKENCQVTLDRLQRSTKPLKLMVELSKNLGQVWESIARNVEQLRPIKDKLFSASGMRIVGYLIAERWDDAAQSVGNLMHSMVFGDTKYVKQRKQRANLMGRTHGFSSEGQLPVKAQADATNAQEIAHSVGHE
eukprot:CAMPEP_0117437258 /NCGR_PEP_ID=MMETSP0759-20121206/1431_1 /TAXON_ID=63605 /ORGANISM="Percolomonas cosmopolitus, Strain WS" /LENGTH=622 /DNA_ID=CAMNT_0005228885 /DNA_START=12 /DNA_END=1880 /DNA_ORIENTATION=-